MRLNMLMASAALLGLLAGCQTTSKPEEPDSYLDLTEAGFELRDYWVPVTEDGSLDVEHSLFFPDVLRERQLSGCAIITFGINSEGRVTGYRPVYSYPSGDVAMAAGAEMSRVRWKPTERNANAEPALGNGYFVFHMENGNRNQAEFEKHCTELSDKDIEASTAPDRSSLKRFPPRYPMSEATTGTEGCATVEYVVTPENEIVDVKVVESTNSSFAREAKNVVPRWNWSELPEGSVTEPMTMQTRFEFCLEDGSGRCSSARLANKKTCPGNDVVSSVGRKMN